MPDSVFPISFSDKIDSPDLVAYFAQFPETSYLSAAQINIIKAALNELNLRFSGVPANTDELPEGSVNFYFASAKCLATVLTGLSVTGGAIVSTDTLLQAFGKLQNQINVFNSIKRTHTVIFSSVTNMTNFTDWYSKSRSAQTFGGTTYVAYAGLTPTNDFADDTYIGYTHIIPFQCKVKSVFVKGRSNMTGVIPIDVAIQTVEFPNGANDGVSSSGLNHKIIARETVTQTSGGIQPNVKFASGSLVTTHNIAEKSLCKLFIKNNFGASAGTVELSVIVEFEEL